MSNRLLILGVCFALLVTVPAALAQKPDATPVPGQPQPEPPPLGTLPPGMNAPLPVPGGELPPGVSQPGAPLPQADPVMDGTRVPYEITRVTLETIVARDRTLYTVHITGVQTDTCDFPPVEAFNYETGWLVLEWYRVIPPNVRCAAGEATVETTLTLDPLLLDSTPRVVEDQPYSFYAVEINDYVALLALGDVAAELFETERELVPVETVEALMLDEFTGVPSPVLRVTGTLPDGCLLPVRGAVEVVPAEVVPTEEAAGGNASAIPAEQLAVTVYRPAPTANITCPVAEVPVVYTLDVPLAAVELAPGDYAYAVNDLAGQVTLTGGPMRREFIPDNANPNRSDHVITAAEAQIQESSPPQVVLNVTGYIPDGCPGEETINIRQQGANIVVEIYRTLPANMMCPQVIREYTGQVQLGTLTAGTYTVSINGFVLTVTVQ